jgi:drug/metabolite transporter (DMT)-like permease
LGAQFSRRQRVTASVLVLVAAVCFSAKAVLVKLAYRHSIDGTSLLTLRMAFALPFFAGIAVWTRKRAEREGATAELAARDWLSIIGLGLSGYYAASLLDFLGLAYVTAGLERLILYLYPTMVLAMSALFLKTKVTRAQVVALLLTYGGVALALLDRTEPAAGSNIPLGAALIFLSGFAYSIYLVGSGPYIARIGALRYTSLAMTAAGAGVILHHGIVHRWVLFGYPRPVYWIALIMALLSTVLPTLLMSEAIRVIGAGSAAIIGSIGPVATLGLGYFFLGETFGVLQLLGTLLVIVGVLRLSFGGRPPRISGYSKT